MTEELVKAQLRLIEKEAEYNGSSLYLELNKLIGDAPTITGADLYRGYLIDQYSCPNCERSIGDEIGSFNYCPSCGTRIRKK